MSELQAALKVVQEQDKFPLAYYCLDCFTRMVLEPGMALRKELP